MANWMKLVQPAQQQDDPAIDWSQVQPLKQRTFGEALSDTGTKVMGSLANVGAATFAAADNLTGHNLRKGLQKQLGIDAPAALTQAQQYWDDKGSPAIKQRREMLGQAEGFCEHSVPAGL